MLSKKKKLRSYEHVYTLKKGKRIHGELFTLVMKETNFETTRCSVTVSKKVAKKAVRRNFLKRKVFNFLHKTYPQFRLGYDIVIIVQKDFLLQDSYNYETELSKILSPIISNSQVLK